LVFEGKIFKEFKKLVREKKLFLIKNKLLILDIGIDFLTKFKEVIVMSYLIEGSVLYNVIKSHGYEVEKLQVNEEGTDFAKWDKELAKKRANEVKKLIKIKRPTKNSVINNYKFSYSAQRKWDAKTKRDVSKHLFNFCDNRRVGTYKIMWSSFKDSGLDAKRFNESFVPYNCRATNKFSSAEFLYYAVEKHNNPVLKRYCAERYGFKVDESFLALDAMVQWIFRSAIRNGKEISVMILSAKMRNLLNDWLSGKVFQ
jgi:hypothetical protein